MSVVAREILNKNGVRARLIGVAPDTAFDRHRHANVYVSLMLLGSMQERSSCGEYEFLSPHAAFMPPDFYHANLYGRHGALDLVFDFSIDMLESEFDASCINRCARRVDNAKIASLVASLNGKPSSWREDGLMDLLALGLPDPDKPSRLPPSWLARARAYFDDDPAAARVAKAAEYCGVHRVHLVRAFRDHLGLTPTEYRLQAMTAKAMQFLKHSPDSITHIAIEAGFSDAAHLAREMRRRVGAPPSVLRSLIRQ